METRRHKHRNHHASKSSRSGVTSFCSDVASHGWDPVNTHSMPVLLRGELLGGSLTGNTAQSVTTCRSCTELEGKICPHVFVWCAQSYPRSEDSLFWTFRPRLRSMWECETHLGLRPSLTCFIHLRTVSVLLCTSGAHSAVSCSPMHYPMTIHSRGSTKGSVKIARTRANACPHCSGAMSSVVGGDEFFFTVSQWRLLRCDTRCNSGRNGVLAHGTR